MAEQRQLLDHRDLFHVGHMVADIEAAQRELSERFGYSWSPVKTQGLRAWVLGGEPRDLEAHSTYSREGPMHVELGDLDVGRVWPRGDLVVPHHFGYWCDHIDETREGLVASGWTIEVEISVAHLAPKVPVLRAPSGFRVELVPRSAEARVDAWVAS